MHIEIWSDVICPWCYVGTARFDKALAAFTHRDHVEVVHRSFELDTGHDPSHIEPVPDFLAKRFGRQGPIMDEQVAALARREDLQYRTDRQVGSTLDAHRLLHLAKDNSRQRELLSLLFEANFAKAESIFTRSALLELAIQAGLERDTAKTVLEDDDAYLDEVRADEKEATRLGASAVPYFLINHKHALSGAQDTQTFARALRAVWDAQHPSAAQVGTKAGADGAVCGSDGACAISGAL